MNETQRQAVIDNARYLQEVRPIDPDEIQEYVEGQPHPAAITQVLREEAVDLGLIERADGTFVPVGDDPLSLSFEGVDGFPETYGRILEELLVDEFGPGWPDGDAGDSLRERIREVKASYLAAESVSYDRLTALGYAIYHLPAYYAATQYVLADLIAETTVPQNLSVLDVGAGVGGPTLGLIDLLTGSDGPGPLIDYHAVEPSAAAELVDTFLDESGPNVHSTVHRERAQNLDLDGSFDLVLFANVLSELNDPVSVLDRYLEFLADDGTLVALAPADENTATGLRAIERQIERTTDATVYAPTVRLWPGESPTSTCWSFDTAPDLAVPGFQRRLDEGDRATRSTTVDRAPGDGEFVNVDCKYAYSLLRTDGRTRIDYRPNADRVAVMATIDDHVTERINLAGVKLSPDLSSDPGANPLFLVGDGSEQVDHFAVLSEESALNCGLLEADYGEALRFENVLVLWNDDEAAYNLVVEAETVVDRIPP